MSKLVIVESPAKAKTISRFLGKDYDVQASFGHIRDLPDSAEDIPEKYKKEKWAKLGVNVDNGFEPLYIIPSDKKKYVDQLKRSAKEADELLLATDEDREGESISWHILQILKPSSKIKVRRIVFHEITPEAISEALLNPRQVDEDLVRAQEARRILDRLFGYTLSPLLWKKVAPRLSAGRVQSVAVRLCVMRERDRMSFRSAGYFDLEADLSTGKGTFKVKLNGVDNKKVATGKSFDPLTGLLRDDKDLWVREADADALAESARSVQPWQVTKVETSPGTEKPPEPFMTSTLQQEANRKLGFGSERTMRIAQNLYEGIDLDGERVGLITYMRTDSLTLSERALTEAREVIRDLYGKEYLPDQPKRYKSKSKGAQEAHEAIRPSALSRRPQDVEKYLDKDQAALYELIWKRTIACQMLPARVLRTAVEVEAKTKSETQKYGASGKQITFPGFLRAYVEGSDDPDSELEGKETILPPLEKGMDVEWTDIRSVGHETKPPARYTEASLVKTLEEEGVGRPSTYASIITTIQNRGYVFKKGKELVPTFTAFAVTSLLEGHFRELVDTTFTAKMENELDDIAEGKLDWVKHLHRFYLGSDKELGLQKQVETESKDIPYPLIELGLDPVSEAPIVVRVGKFGAFLQRGEGGAGNTANVPEDMPPADLTVALAIDMIDRKTAGPEAIGVDPSSGLCVFHRKGRFGDYLEVDQSEAQKEAGETPRRVTLPPGLTPGSIEDSDLALLMKFPVDLGKHPESGEPVGVFIGRYGSYVKCGTENRTVEDWRKAASISLSEALELLSQPKVRARGGASATPAVAIQEFGPLDGAAGNVRVLPGRYGPYVTDGKTNATIPKTVKPEDLTPEQAMTLIRARLEAGPAKKRFVKKKATARSK